MGSNIFAENEEDTKEESMLRPRHRWMNWPPPPQPESASAIANVVPAAARTFLMGTISFGDQTAWTTNSARSRHPDGTSAFSSRLNLRP